MNAEDQVMRPGDPVTILRSDGPYRVTYERTQDVRFISTGAWEPCHFFRDAANIEFVRRVTTEGKEWIRGHHDKGCAELSALLAARALSYGLPLPPLALP